LLRRTLVVAVAATAVSTAAAGPAFACQDAVDVHVQCVWDNADGSLTSVWSYVNHTTSAVDIPIGPDNRITTAPDDRGQPTHFLPGQQLNAWVYTFNGSSLAWHVLTNGDTANNGSVRCPTTPVPVVGNWAPTVIGLVLLVAAAYIRGRRTWARSSGVRALLRWRSGS
jgi:hypothetical protein